MATNFEVTPDAESWARADQGVVALPTVVVRLTRREEVLLPLVATSGTLAVDREPATYIGEHCAQAGGGPAGEFRRRVSPRLDPARLPARIAVRSTGATSLSLAQESTQHLHPLVDLREK